MELEVVDKNDDIEAGNEDQKVKPLETKVVADVPSGPPPFDFFRELNIMNKQVVALSDYPSFLLKWTILQLLTISGSVSFLIFTVVQKELDVSKMTTELHMWFVVIGVLQVLSRVSPPCNSIIIDQLKGSLQVAHGTSVIRKLFELEHDAMISTPTGKFGQLISKIFMNVDKLLPALYGGVLSTVVNLVVGVVLLGIFFGPISLVLIVLYVAFTIAAYRTAKQAAIRNKDMMTAMLSEWGKLLAIAGSYERAHFFDRVEYEVSNGKVLSNHQHQNVECVAGNAYFIRGASDNLHGHHGVMCCSDYSCAG